MGKRARVKCHCGSSDCLAPAAQGGRAGEVVDVNDDLISVVLDECETIGVLEFPAAYVTPEDA